MCVCLLSCLCPGLQVPPIKLLLLIGLTAWVACSDTLKAHVMCGSAAYWATATSVAPVALALLLGVRSHLLCKAGTMEMMGLQRVKGQLGDWAGAWVSCQGGVGKKGSGHCVSHAKLEIPDSTPTTAYI